MESLTMPPALPPMLQEEEKPTKPRRPARAPLFSPDVVGTNRLVMWGACAAWTFWNILAYQSRAAGQGAFFAAADACVWIISAYVICRAIDEAIFMEHRK